MVVAEEVRVADGHIYGVSICTFAPVRGSVEKGKKNLVAEEVRVAEGHIYGTLTPERRGPRYNRYAVALHPAVATPLTHLYLHSALMEP